jgi:hypothetical protein
LKKFGYKKNRSRTDWQTIAHKIEKRKKATKKSVVYFDGQLVSAKQLSKEISRQGYLTFEEQVKLEEGWYYSCHPKAPLLTMYSAAPDTIRNLYLYTVCSTMQSAFF